MTAKAYPRLGLAWGLGAGLAACAVASTGEPPRDAAADQGAAPARDGQADRSLAADRVEPTDVRDASLPVYPDANACAPADAAAGDGGCGVCEVCGDGLDNDCNGAIDEGCACVPGATEHCHPGPPAQAGVGPCAWGTSACVGSEIGTWGACAGAQAPAAAEACNGVDDDCDGLVDEGCCTTVAYGATFDPDALLTHAFTLDAAATLYPGRALEAQLVGGGWDDCGAVGTFVSTCTMGRVSRYEGSPVVVGTGRSIAASVTNLQPGGCSYGLSIRWCNPDSAADGG